MATVVAEAKATTNMTAVDMEVMTRVKDTTAAAKVTTVKEGMTVGVESTGVERQEVGRDTVVAVEVFLHVQERLFHRFDVFGEVGATAGGFGECR